MDLRQVAYFVAVAEHLSFSRAAERLNLTQPTISQQIRRLEQELGYRLFDRDKGRVRLTREGEIFLVHGRRMLTELHDAREQLKARERLNVGRVLVGALPAVVYHWLPDLLVGLRRDHPGLEVSVTEEGTSQILQALDLGTLDLGIVTLPVDCHRFTSRVLLVEPLFLALPRHHRLAEAAAAGAARHGQRPAVALGEVAEEPFLQYSTTSGLRGVVEQACRTAGFAPHIVLQTLDTGSVKRFVAAGLGVALLPESAVTPADRRQLAVLALRDRPVRTIGLVSRRGTSLPSGARLLAREIERAFRAYRASRARACGDLGPAAEKAGGAGEDDRLPVAATPRADSASASGSLPAHPARGPRLRRTPNRAGPGGFAGTRPLDAKQTGGAKGQHASATCPGIHGAALRHPVARRPDGRRLRGCARGSFGPDVPNR